MAFKSVEKQRLTSSVGKSKYTPLVLSKDKPYLQKQETHKKSYVDRNQESNKKIKENKNTLDNDA